MNINPFPSLLNFLILKYRNVSYINYPSIKGRLTIKGKGKITMGKNVQIKSAFSANPVGRADGTCFIISNDATLSIGNNVGISNTLFYIKTSLTIEDNVLIGGGCQIYDSDFHSLDYEERIHKGDRAKKTAPILIREGAFLGMDVLVLKGVTIGKRSIVAARSVVAKSIPDNEIWGGNPAKFIRKIEN